MDVAGERRHRLLGRRAPGGEEDGDGAEGGEEGGARLLRLLLRPRPRRRMGMKMVGCVIQLLLRVWCAEHRVPLGLQ